MRRRTYLLWKRILIQTACLCLLFGLGYIYFLTPTLTITNYKLIGVPDEYAPKVRSRAYEVSNVKLLGVLPGNRVISFHGQILKESIREILPNSKEIAIHPSGLHTITIRVVPYVPLFSIGETQAVSPEGIVYTTLESRTDLPKLEYASTTQLTAKDLATFHSFVEKVDTVFFPIHFINIDENGDVRLYDSAHATYIAFTRTENLDRVWSNLLSAIDTEPLKSKMVDPSTHIQYLDARFGNKVFYKFTNTSGGAIIQDHASSTQATLQ